jgi:hypothetical protein
VVSSLLLSLVLFNEVMYLYKRQRTIFLKLDQKGCEEGPLHLVEAIAHQPAMN